ncbi:MAG: AAA family ATPase, partial [Clostridia bacterium]|nr:AAA family ATPase [Clostridia bacterium]
LLQVLDDGRITDGQGRTVDFMNTIIILTSNIGSDILLEGMDETGALKPGVEDFVRSELKQRFRPEFINRLDEIAFFKPLTGSDLKSIVDLLFNDLKKRLATRGLTLTVTDAAKAYIVENGSDPQFGARPLKRYIQSHAESLLARYIIRESPAEGTVLTLDADENGLTVR